MKHITRLIAHQRAIPTTLAVAVMTWAAPVDGREVKLNETPARQANHS